MVRASESIRLAEVSDWDNLTKLLSHSPQQAQESDDYGMLPIHWASTEHGVPLYVLQELLKAYPTGAKIKNNANLLPLHIAIRARASPEWLSLLLTSFPSSIVEKTPSGSTPIMLGRRTGLSIKQMRVLLEAKEAFLPEKQSFPEMPTLNRHTSAPATQQQLLRRKSSSLHAQRKLELRDQNATLLGVPSSTSSNVIPSRPPTLSRQVSLPAAPREIVFQDDVSSDEDDGDNQYEEEQQNRFMQEMQNNINVSSAAPTWQKETSCYICHSPFGLFRHRHHCRNCGKSICREHSGGKMDLPRKGFRTAQRICVLCSADNSVINSASFSSNNSSSFSTTTNAGRRSTVDGSRRKSTLSNVFRNTTAAFSVRSNKSHNNNERKRLSVTGSVASSSISDVSDGPVAPATEEDFTAVAPASNNEETNDNNGVAALNAAKMDALQEQVTDLTTKLTELTNANSRMQHTLLEQEEVQAKTMLLLTETMTRVSHLELNRRESLCASNTSSEEAAFRASIRASMMQQQQ